MITRTCPDWPTLMELDPELQFKHYTAVEAKLSAEILMKLPDLPLASAEICCDLEHHVFFADHTDPRLASVLTEADWFEVRDWAVKKQQSRPAS
jgi:hypothetical protein